MDLSKLLNNNASNQGLTTESLITTLGSAGTKKVGPNELLGLMNAIKSQNSNTQPTQKSSQGVQQSFLSPECEAKLLQVLNLAQVYYTNACNLQIQQASSIPQVQPVHFQQSADPEDPASSFVPENRTTPLLNQQE